MTTSAAAATGAQSNASGAARNNATAPGTARTTTAANKSKAQPSAAVNQAAADAAFRQFFSKLSAADLQREAAAAAAVASASAAPAVASVPAAGSVSAAVPVANAQAVECYRQLHSSIPLLHAHHFDALRGWLSACFDARVLPRSLDGETSFRLTPELLEAVRSQARLAPVHSRIAGGDAMKPQSSSANACSSAR